MNKIWMSLLGIVGVSSLGLGVIALNSSHQKNADHVTILGTSLPFFAANSSPFLSQRERVSLNGIWQFSPAQGKNPPSGLAWGKIKVPGSWEEENQENGPGLIERGRGKSWDNFQGKNLTKAWYQRRIDIPKTWQNKRILLELDRLSTDAMVYVNNIPCGEINWPSGVVDITKAVKAGQSATLTLLVAAIRDEKEKTVIMGPTEIYKTQANLDSRGLIGEAWLKSRTYGTYISDIFVQPSTRKKNLTVEIELGDVKQSGQVEFIAQILDEKGKIEKQFMAKSPVKKQERQTLKVQWNWSNPRLWEIGKPYLYTLRLKVQGQEINDVSEQSFGFREFWIEGRKFYLNGTELRLRPMLYDDQWEGWPIGIPQVMDSRLDSYKKLGFNIAQLWPWDTLERGKWHFRELLAERADLKGFPIIGSVVNATRNDYADSWDKSKKIWESQMVKELRRYRNHPSILFWSTSPNFFGHSDDQNPRRIGQKTITGAINPIEDDRMKRLVPVGNDAAKTVQKYDPTRPVMFHQGASAGDIYALNSYLNMIPLQEREEWLSEWIQKGDMPYMVVEFGTPLHTTMMRSRNGFSSAISSEPLMTEFTAIYLGKEAYQLETSEYRWKIQELFIKDQEYKSWHLKGELDFAPAFQKLQELFITNTWRSWRTWGMTGGMIPWTQAHGWMMTGDGWSLMDFGKFSPGQRGVSLEKIQRKYLSYLQPEIYKIQPAGQSLINNNNATLAWISGSSSSFTEKDHNFLPGEKLQKQIVVINDQRSSQDFSLNWQVFLQGKKITEGQKSGKIDPAKTLFFPVDVTLPNSENRKESGEIRLQAKIGNQTHSDQFNFRVFPPFSPVKNETLTVFDPVGKTTPFLQKLGYQIIPWNGKATVNNNLLLIGRESLSQGNSLPGNLQKFVENGGRVIVFTQNPNWLKDQIGFRVSPHLSRRLFPVNENHPITQGLDELDLKDWRGISTLIDAYPDLRVREHPYKKYGWRWGNRGALSSANLEKPHRSGWRPILEGEFDLAYSPLMELDYGKGRLILNTLDVEDHQQDPANLQLTKQLINYAKTAPILPKVTQVIFKGNNQEEDLLKLLGVVYQVDSSPEFKPGNLYIIGQDENPPESQVKAFLESGGKLLFLPRQNSGLLGINLKKIEDFRGSFQIPSWSEMRGISPSDLRSRSYYETSLIQSGGEIGAEGLLSRVKIGSGVAIFTQINPDNLQADEKTYLRYTRWRYTRALSQILANLGASFSADSQIFNPGKYSNFYHPDYRQDFELGDDPYRYYRW